MKIMTIVGARPQFIKAAAVSRAILRNKPESIKEVIVHTGQHFDENMSGVFFEQMGIPQPDYNLKISSLDHGAMTGRMLEGIESLIKNERPDWMLVYGDTNSTLAGALAATKLHIPVAHVEAGLRSFNLNMPEEVNRVLTDRISTLLFCPTSAAIENLKKEGYPFLSNNKKPQEIENVGDVMYDVTMYYAEQARSKIDLSKWGLSSKEYILCTLHRAENTSDYLRLKNILTAIYKISRTCTVVLPLHPRTKSLLAKNGLEHLLDGIKLLDPVPYLEMQRLEMGARTILTDSGGVQKEAFFHKVPCITLRDETEWVETVEAGWNVLTGSDTDEIINAFSRDIVTKNNLNPFGNGHASELIVERMANSR